jgi:AraC-like DNA-binding protein
VGNELVGSEQAKRGPGDLLLAAPGVPHWIEITEYPLDFVTVYFLPSLLIDLGPEGDGLMLLRRFTAPQEIHQRLVRPSRSLRTSLENKFTEMVDEFEHQQFGHETRLRTLLLEILVELIRWEHQTGRQIDVSELPVEWRRLHVALKYLQTNFNKAIYASDVARAAGVTESQLMRLFRTALGLTWGKYLQHYRIHRAAMLLSEGQCSVLEASLEVGFETMSHFNSTFRAIMGSSPSEYRRQVTAPAHGSRNNSTAPPRRRLRSSNDKNR